MSAEDLALWEEYYQIEPWGTLRDDLRAGMIASMTVSPWLPKGRICKPSDLFPTLAEDEPEDTPETLAAKAQAFAIASRARRGRVDR